MARPVAVDIAALPAPGGCQAGRSLSVGSYTRRDPLDHGPVCLMPVAGGHRFHLDPKSSVWPSYGVYFAMLRHYTALFSPEK